MDSHERMALARAGRERKHRERMEGALELRGKGYTWRDIAGRYGVSDVRGFKMRVVRYARENGLEVPEAPSTADVVLGIVDELLEKLAEIRRRYE